MYYSSLGKKSYSYWLISLLYMTSQILNKNKKWVNNLMRKNGFVRKLHLRKYEKGERSSEERSKEEQRKLTWRTHNVV